MTDAEGPERGRVRSLESVIAAFGEEDATRLARPWPIHGRAAAPYDEQRFQDACRADAVTAYVLCLREELMRCDDGTFVAAAFKIVAGHEPDRSIWHHHVARLAAGEVSREDLLSELQPGPDRRVVIFDGRALQPFAEMTGLGLRDMLRVLVGLATPRVRRRLDLVARRLRRRS